MNKLFFASMFTQCTLFSVIILYNRSGYSAKRRKGCGSMAVLTLRSEEMNTFPAILREFASYKSVIEGCTEKTVCEYLSDLRTFFRYLEARRLRIDFESEDFFKIDISSISIDDIRKITGSDVYEFMLYAGQNRNNGWSAKSRKLSTLKVFFKYLHIHKRLLEKDPTEDIGAPRRHTTLPKFLTLDESIMLLEAVKNDTESKTQARDFAIVTLFLNCGMRLSELVGIDLTDLDRELKSLRVTGKGNKERVVYLNNACRAALMEYIYERQKDETSSIKTMAFFLSSRKTRISNKTVQWMVYKYLDAAGLSGRGLSVHKLRHTAATLMYQSGEVDVRVLKDILGHAQLNTTQIYTHVSDENMENAVAANPLASVKIRKAKRPPSDED